MECLELIAFDAGRRAAQADTKKKRRSFKLEAFAGIISIRFGRTIEKLHHALGKKMNRPAIEFQITELSEIQALVDQCELMFSRSASPELALSMRQSVQSLRDIIRRMNMAVEDGYPMTRRWLEAEVAELTRITGAINQTLGATAPDGASPAT